MRKVYLKCHSCKIRKKDVKKTIDPYMSDVEDMKIHVKLCDDCYKEACYDI